MSSTFVTFLRASLTPLTCQAKSHASSHLTYRGTILLTAAQTKSPPGIFLDNQHHCGYPSFHSELCVDPLQMLLHGARADPQFVGNTFIASPIGKMAQYVPLLRCKRREVCF